VVITQDLEIFEMKAQIEMLVMLSLRKKEETLMKVFSWGRGQAIQKRI
jgi:hypothetical protein